MIDSCQFNLILGCSISFGWGFWFGMWVRRRRTKKSMISWMTGWPPKDPMDWSKTFNSTHWEDEKCCPHCFETVEVGQRLTNMCPSCGSNVNLLAWKTRAFRKIWNGSKWVRQDKYGNGPTDYTIDGKQPVIKE